MSKLDNNKVVFTTSIDPELKKQLKIYCANTDQYQNEVIENLIKELLDKHGKEGGDNGNTNK